MSYNRVLLPAVTRCHQFRVLSAKAFPAENAIHPQTLKLILTIAVGWCCYLPAGIHLAGIGTERAQNFINLKKYCKILKLAGGKTYSESLLDNLHKVPCVCRKYQLLRAWQITSTVVPLVLLEMSLRLPQSIISPTHNLFWGFNFTSMEIPWTLRLARSVEMIQWSMLSLPESLCQ